MAAVSAANRPPSRRPVLVERQPSAAPKRQPVKAPNDGSQRLPHHRSLTAGGCVNAQSQEIPHTAAAENQRVCALVNDTPSHSNRNSAISTSSTASGKSRRKTHVGPWQLGKTLGKGATGRVRLAKHALTGQVAAIKIVSKRSAALVQSTSMARIDEDTKLPCSAAGFRLMPFGIEREVVIMKLIEHPNIVNLYDVWENRGELYLVLEYVAGGELFDNLVCYGRYDEDEAIHLFRQILASLSYCHRFNICHRDLKPENVLLDGRGNVKLADFGMAAFEPNGRWLNTACGSPHYAAPEIVAGKEYRGHKADIWSVGVMLYVMLTGCPPFDGSDVPSILSSVQFGEYHLPDELSDEAVDLIQSMLQQRPEKRISMSAIWAHPLLKKYEKRHASVAPKDFLAGPAPSLSAEDCGPPIGKRSNIDAELLRNLQTLWYGVKQEELVARLLSGEPTHERLLYNSLVRFRAEQLENYQGVPLEYSASDYHHLAKPTPISASRLASSHRSLNPQLRRSQFSFISEEGYGRKPQTASDPGHATRLRKESSDLSYSKNASHGAGLRRSTGNRFQTQLHSSQGMSCREHGGTGQPRRPLSSNGHSRNSLASSRRSDAVSRNSGNHKRQVSFQYTRAKTSRNSSKAQGVVRPTSSGTGASNREKLAREMADDQSNPSLPTPPRVHRPRKPASELDVKKTRAVSHYWRDEARQVSSELGKFCEEAFNRSSNTSDDHQRGYHHEPVRPNPVIPLSDRLKDRPLPQPPTESLGSFTLRELAETRRRLLEQCQQARSDPIPSYLTDVIAHLDSLMQPGSKWEQGETRSASDPNPGSARNAYVLPAIIEQRGFDDGSDGLPSGRSTSNPLKTVKVASCAEPSQTVRLVSAEASLHQRLPAIQPLSIRKKHLQWVDSSGATTPEMGPSEADKSGYDRVLFGNLGTIEEHPSSPKVKDVLGSPVANRKRSWFKRQSDPCEDVPASSSGKQTSLSDERLARTEAQPKQTTASQPRKKHGIEGISSEPSGTSQTGEGGKKWLNKLFNKRSKKSRPNSAAHRVKRDGSSETDSNTTSSDYIPVDIGDQKPKEAVVKGTSSGDRRAHKIDQGFPSASTAGGHKRANQVSQNWFNKFFHIKPASRVICMSVSKAKARREVVRVLRDWKRYGLRDVVSEQGIDGGGDLITARLDPINYLNLKPVHFHADVFTILERGRRCNLSAIRFSQDHGAASSFYKVVETLAAVLQKREMTVVDATRRKGIERSMKEAAGLGV